MLQSRPMCSFNFGTPAPNAGVLYAAPRVARAARRRTFKPRLFARATLHYAAASLRRSRASRRSMHQCLIRKPAKKKASLVARRAALARFLRPSYSAGKQRSAFCQTTCTCTLCARLTAQRRTLLSRRSVSGVVPEKFSSGEARRVVTVVTIVF